ncbi:MULTISPECIES: integrase core domain-containing protein [Acinetobacter]|uniref:integrase core domain-containing protein n=1 Tax=Acinetobacter TaxID=469 RepID=UPI0022E2F6A1|nr:MULTISPECIES: transposase [Acinetobacter]MDI1224256.1 transposase [Acinetobacter sp.]
MACQVWWYGHIIDGTVRLESATFVLKYIQPGKLQQNAYIECYNRTTRYSRLSKHLFNTLNEVQDYATSLLWHYNHKRPHQANKGKPP